MPRHPAPEHAILFVCLGNICRSPTAEAVFRQRAARQGLADRWLIDSAGTGDYQIGEPPDVRAVQHARKRGYDLGARRARQVSADDFERFDWILAMDRSNLSALDALRPSAYQGHLGLLLDFAPELGVRDVPDPYEGGAHGFERVLDLIEPACDGLIAHLSAFPRT